jgi:hypothetical protein
MIVLLAVLSYGPNPSRINETMGMSWPPLVDMLKPVKFLGTMGKDNRESCGQPKKTTKNEITAARRGGRSI